MFVSTNVTFDEGRSPFRDDKELESRLSRIWGESPHGFAPVILDLNEVLHDIDSPVVGPSQIIIDGAVAQVERCLDCPVTSQLRLEQERDARRKLDLQREK
eukprot:2241058-Rhodomonas_salina.1